LSGINNLEDNAFNKLAKEVRDEARAEKVKASTEATAAKIRLENEAKQAR
jgi:hypothetical protein